LYLQEGSKLKVLPDKQSAFGWLVEIYVTIPELYIPTISFIQVSRLRVLLFAYGNSSACAAAADKNGNCKN